VSATALGKNLPNEVLLNCASGKVGIQYQSPLESKEELFLSTGTARSRTSTNPAQARILVLSSLSSIKALAKQCIEEEPQWEAFCESNLKSVHQLFENTKWFAVLVSNELKEDPKWMPLIKEISQANPKIQFRWVGNDCPKELLNEKNWKTLPPLDPILLPHFKKLLRKAFSDYQYSETSDTLHFPKNKSK
jgi:hypothetical protein